MTYTLGFDFYIGIQNTGLTMAGQILDSDGNDEGSEITTGITEIGDGHYYALVTTIPDAHRGAIKFYESGSATDPLATFAINPEEGEYIDSAISDIDADDLLDVALSGHTTSGTVGAALNRLGTGIISSTSIVAADNTVTTYEGDDYNNTDGRALDWTEESGSIWPTDLTGATISVTIADYDVAFSGSVVTATGTSQKVRLELTSAQTTLIPPGSKTYMVRATLSAVYSSRQATLVRGTWAHYNKIAAS